MEYGENFLRQLVREPVHIKPEDKLPIIDRTYCPPTYDPTNPEHNCLNCDMLLWNGIHYPNGKQAICGKHEQEKKHAALRQHEEDYRNGLRPDAPNMWTYFGAKHAVWTISFARRFSGYYDQEGVPDDPQLFDVTA